MTNLAAFDWPTDDEPITDYHSEVAPFRLPVYLSIAKRRILMTDDVTEAFAVDRFDRLSRHEVVGRATADPDLTGRRAEPDPLAEAVADAVALAGARV